MISSVEDAGTGRRFDTVILRLINADLKTTLKRNGWKFNWGSEWKHKDHQVYKLVIKGDTIIQG
jgi:predicted transcriptional regulator